MARPITLFSWGYDGWGGNTGELLRLSAAVEKRRGFKPPLFVEIKVSRSGRSKGFSGDAFEQDAKRRYRWMKDLGNQSVATGGRRTKIRRPEAADELLDEAIRRAKRRQRIIFFCGCDFPFRCHRKDVAELLVKAARRRRQPIEIVEWPGADRPAKPVEVRVSPQALRKLRKDRSSLAVPASRRGELAGLPTGSLVKATASGEEPLTFVTWSLHPHGDRWYLDWLWHGESARTAVKPNARDVSKWLRETGYTPHRYQPSR